MIFCVEDDPNIRELEVYTLQFVGFKALGVGSGEELFKALECAKPTLILLDIMLPGDDGITLLKQLRSDKRTAQVPVIMATAKGSKFDKVHGLDNGADDYIAKPFGMVEMVSRVKAVLRRYKQDDKQGRLTAGELVMEIDKHRVLIGGQEVILTFKEFELLHKLLERSGQVFTREQLLTDIWGYDFAGETRTVDVHVRTLRLKLGKAGSLIETVRGVGYRIGAGYEK
ncbi:MAG: winged helix-turn-helix domain-containing protein [Acidaminococcaceae bacterium]|nr:winged helix-turn-helix domain-containing protein [Acidaminococcaceae bacterium]